MSKKNQPTYVNKGQVKRPASKLATREAECETNMRRVMPASAALARQGNAVVIAMDHENRAQVQKKFIDGLNLFTRRKNGRVLWLPAEGHIQGEALSDSDAEASLGAISQLRRKTDGFHILAFTGMSFGKDAGGGTEIIRNRLTDLIEQQREYQRGRFLISFRGLGILGYGTGLPCDLPSHPDFRQRPQPDEVGQVFDGTWFSLAEGGQLSTMYLEPGIPRPRVDPTRLSDLEDPTRGYQENFPVGGPLLGVPNSPGHLVMPKPL